MRKSNLVPFYQSNLSPFHMLRKMDREIDEMFDNINRGRGSSYETPMMGQFRESDEAYLVTFDMPGVRLDDINIQAQEGRVTISAERRAEYEKGESLRKYSQSFTIPDNVDPDQIQARYEDGVLNLGLPKVKREARDSKQIEVKSDSKPQSWLKFLGFRQEDKEKKISESTKAKQ